MNELVNTAVELMLMGMGTVFVFLIVLIFATRFMSAMAMHFSTVEEPAQSEPRSPQASQSRKSSVKDEKLVKIISEAIKQHRSS